MRDMVSRRSEGECVAGEINNMSNIVSQFCKLGAAEGETWLWMMG